MPLDYREEFPAVECPAPSPANDTQPAPSGPTLPPVSPEASAQPAGCQRCGSMRIAVNQGGTIFTQDYATAAVLAGAVTRGNKLGPSKMRFCLDCGQVQGRFPAPTLKPNQVH